MRRQRVERRLEHRPRFAQRPLGGHHRLDVDEGHHHADDRLVGGPVWQKPHQQASARVIADAFLADLAGGEHFPHQTQQVVDLQTVRDVLDRPADVLRQQVDLSGDRGRELAHAQIAVEKDRPDLGALKKIVDVVVELDELLDLALVLRVDGVELLVDGVQLFVGALQLLVGGEQLLVGGLELLVGGFQLLDRRLEILAGLPEFVFQVGNPLTRNRAGFEDLLGGGTGGDANLLEKDDEEHVLAPARRQLLHSNLDRPGSFHVPRLNVRVGDLVLLVGGAVQGRGQDHRQLVLDHLDHVAGGLAAGHLEEPGRVAENVDQLVVGVDQ